MTSIMKHITKSIKSYVASILVFTIMVTGVVGPLSTPVRAQAQSIASQVIEQAQEIIVEATEDGTKISAIYDKSTHQIHLLTQNEAQQHTYEVRIQDIIDANNARLWITDEHGESMSMGFGTFESKSNLRSKRAIPLLLAAIAGVVARQVIQQALRSLIASGVLIYIGEQAYVVVTEIAKTLREQRQYEHYQARIINGDVYIGKGLTFEEAIVHLRTTGRDGGVWSVNNYRAEKIARDAGGGARPVGPKKHCDGETGSYVGYYYHYHIKGHIGGHSWYGGY